MFKIRALLVANKTKCLILQNIVVLAKNIENLTDLQIILRIYFACFL